MATVQFIGKDSVVDAYNDLNGVSWGLYVGAKPVMYGSGGDSLEEWLDRFDPAGSTGVYTLRVYDCETTWPLSTLNSPTLIMGPGSLVTPVSYSTGSVNSRRGWKARIKTTT